MIILKSPHEIECIRKASKLTADTLSLLVEKAKPGITTLELDTIAEEYIRSHGGIPVSYTHLIARIKTVQREVELKSENA